VTCVHPGGIKTAIARNARTTTSHDPQSVARLFDTKLAKTTAERAAEIIVDGTLRNRPRIVVGSDAKLLDAYVRLAGARYQRSVAAIAGRMMPTQRR
jgi:short-subunit dehydrogenase